MLKMKTHYSVCVHILILSLLQLLQGNDYEHNSRVKQSRVSLEQQIRSASNVRELLSIFNSLDCKLWKCRQKLRHLVGLDTRSRSTRFASPYYDPEILNSIDEEWLKTQCVPRESCVDVAKELGSGTNTFFKPPCVSVYRCGGCCNEEGLVCTNISTSYIRKALFEIAIPLTNVPELVTIKVANHTACRCISSRHKYSIIRRSTLTHFEESCLHSDSKCFTGQVWDKQKCHCVTLDRRQAELSPITELALCGPYRQFDEDMCDCVCRNIENQETCFWKQKIFDPYSCSCVDRHA